MSNTDMSCCRPNDQPSLASLTSFQIRRAAASFSDNLRGLQRSASSSSSASSFSSSEASTEATTVSRDDDFSLIGDLYMVKPDRQSCYTFSEAQQNLLLSIESQLCDVLGAKKHEYLIRMRVVGRKPWGFRPAIVLATSSVRTKLALTSYLLTGPAFMAGLRECRLDLHVILASAGAACGFSGSSGGVPIQEDISVFVDTLGPCGARMLVKSPNHDQLQYCVAGGILVVDGRNVLTGPHHAIACAEDVHSIWHSATQIPDLNNIPEKYKTSFSIYYDNIGHNSSYWDYNSQANISASNLCKNANNGSSTPPPETGRRTQLTKKSTTLKMTQDSLYRTDVYEYNTAHISLRTSVSDCVTLKLECVEAQSSASRENLNTVAGFVINEVHDSKIDSSLPVTIALPEGEIRGELHGETVIYTVGSHTYKLKTVTTDVPLQRGCSGAWVTYKNQLCGVIAAISDDEPEIFILPFEQIIEDLERVSGGPVQLPQTNSSTSMLSPKYKVESAHGDAPLTAAGGPFNASLSSNLSQNNMCDRLAVDISEYSDFSGIAEISRTEDAWDPPQKCITGQDLNEGVSVLGIPIANKSRAHYSDFTTQIISKDGQEYSYSGEEIGAEISSAGHNHMIGMSACSLRTISDLQEAQPLSAASHTAENVLKWLQSQPIKTYDDHRHSKSRFNETRDQGQQMHPTAYHRSLSNDHHQKCTELPDMSHRDKGEHLTHAVSTSGYNALAAMGISDVLATIGSSCMDDSGVTKITSAQKSPQTIEWNVEVMEIGQTVTKLSDERKSSLT